MCTRIAWSCEKTAPNAMPVFYRAQKSVDVIGFVWRLVQQIVCIKSKNFIDWEPTSTQSYIACRNDPCHPEIFKMVTWKGDFYHQTSLVPSNQWTRAPSTLLNATTEAFSWDTSYKKVNTEMRILQSDWKLNMKDVTFSYSGVLRSVKVKYSTLKKDLKITLGWPFKITWQMEKTEILRICQSNWIKVANNERKQSYKRIGSRWLPDSKLELTDHETAIWSLNQQRLMQRKLKVTSTLTDDSTHLG